MASVFKRQGYATVDGKRVKAGAPYWTARFNTGVVVDGVAKFAQKAVPSKHCASKVTARRWADAYEAEEQAKAKAGTLEPTASKLCGDLIDRWLETLTNFNAEDDRARVKKHVRPRFEKKAITDIRVKHVMQWIDDMRALRKKVGEGEDAQEVQALSDSTLRHNLNLLGRFFSWAITRGHVEQNPVRSIPSSVRPREAPKVERPYVNDDVQVRKIFKALPSPINLMFWIGHTSGLRPSEIVALRISDLDAIADGTIRARAGSRDGELKVLKEDKSRKGMAKVVPIGKGAEKMLRPWLNRREAEEAQPEDLVFVAPGGGMFSRMQLSRAWREVRTKLGIKVGMYEATRHSFASRLLEGGNSMDEVSAALNHSSVVVTKRHYARWERSSYSPSMRLGVTVAPRKEDAKTIPIGAARRRRETAAASGDTGAKRGTGAERSRTGAETGAEVDKAHHR